MLNHRTLMFVEPSFSDNVSHYTTILILPHITRLDLCLLEFCKLEGDEEQTCKTSSRTSKLQWTPPRCDTNSEYPNANDKACSAHIDKIISIDYTSHDRNSQRNVGRILIHITFDSMERFVWSWTPMLVRCLICVQDLLISFCRACSKVVFDNE